MRREDEEEEGDFLERRSGRGCARRRPARLLRRPRRAPLTFEEIFSSCSSDATFSATVLFECQTAGFSFRARWSFFGFARSFSTSPTGSPVEAFSTSPPSSIAISVSSRFDTTERGRVSAMSSSDAKSSRCLMRSHAGASTSPSPSCARGPTSPSASRPSRVNLRSPFFESRVDVGRLRSPRAAVPDHDRPAAVLARGDDPLERSRTRAGDPRRASPCA